VIDYHVHTNRCGHADGEAVDYVRAAINFGLDEIGFNDHLPLRGNSGKELGLAMALHELPDYVNEVLELRKSFPEIKVKLGVEADYTPDTVTYTKDLLAEHDFDYVTGSVHYIGEWAFDHPGEREKWDSKDVDLVYKEYFELLRKSARTLLFDIIGGGIRRIKAKEPMKDFNDYGKHGIWYDMLQDLTEKITADPTNKVLLKERGDLFKQVGLPEVADLDYAAAKIKG
jgi:HisJ family histidinol phosphate phosphatase